MQKSQGKKNLSISSRVVWLGKKYSTKKQDKRRSEASGKIPMSVYFGNFIFTTGGFMFYLVVFTSFRRKDPKKCLSTLSVPSLNFLVWDLRQGSILKLDTCFSGYKSLIFALERCIGAMEKNRNIQVKQVLGSSIYILA